MTKILQKETIKLYCPHCRFESNDTWICQLDSIIGKRYAYICGNCERLLGIVKDLISNTAQLKLQISFSPN